MEQLPTLDNLTGSREFLIPRVEVESRLVLGAGGLRRLGGVSACRQFWAVM